MGKGFWAVLDQGLFAASNFALNVLLARWLIPQDYGAFTVSYTIFLFLGSLHNGLFGEPLLIFGAKKYGDSFPAYLGIVLRWHAAFGAAGALLLLLGGLGLGVAGSDGLPAMFVALSLAAPFILLLWLLRLACYARLRPRLAAAGGAVYAGLITAGAYALYRVGGLTGASALVLMGAASLLVAAWLALRLGVQLRGTGEGGFASDVARDHLEYGRWSVPTRVFTYLPGNIFYLVLPLWGGLQAGAALRALMNAIMPVLQAYAALSTLLTSALSRARGTPKFAHSVRLALAFFVAGAGVYWAFLAVAHDWVVAVLYGGRYAGSADLLPLLGLLPVTAGALAVLGAAIKAQERPDLMFRAYALTALVALTLGVALVAYGGLTGAVAGLLLSSAVTTVVAFRYRLVENGDSDERGRDAGGVGREI